MIGKISPAGTLLIKRKSDFKEVLCPFDTAGNVVCGDWCALFCEPTQRKAFTELILCHRVYSFIDFEDMR